MQAAMDRALEQNAAGVRLVQAAFHNRSLSLYTSLGFDIRRAPLLASRAAPSNASIPGCTVRPATPNDEYACNALIHQVHGFARSIELAQAIEHGTAHAGARRPHHRLHHPPRLLRPLHRRDQRRPASPHRLRRILRRPRHPRPLKKQRPPPLAPRQRPPRSPTHDPHDHRPLHRTSPRQEHRSPPALFF